MKVLKKVLKGMKKVYKKGEMLCCQLRLAWLWLTSAAGELRSSGTSGASGTAVGLRVPEGIVLTLLLAKRQS